jgi:ribonuclease-3
LEKALIHSSYVNENPGITPASNERLEFLGDAILDLLVAEKLYHDQPGASEGELTRQRAGLVSGKALARLAAGIDLGRYLYLGKGEQSSGGHRKPSNLAAALEAVIAAVYLDSGLPAARALVLRLLEKDKTLSEDRTDFKSQLQEMTQARWQSVPEYRTIEATGPAHARRFTVEVSAAGDILGRGTGRSKRTAEQAAARTALDGFPAASPEDTG